MTRTDSDYHCLPSASEAILEGACSRFESSMQGRRRDQETIGEGGEPHEAFKERFVVGREVRAGIGNHAVGRSRTPGDAPLMRRPARYSAPTTNSNQQRWAPGGRLDAQ
jgi:hypothetical protein